MLRDENVEAIDFDTDADWIGLTGYIVHKARMFEIIDAFKARGRRIAVGGPFATLCPEQLRDKVDVLFVGESERTWPRFLSDLAAGEPRAEYHADALPELDDAPIPRFDLLKLNRYRSMAVQFARGCPYTCEFCDIIVMYGRRPRTKPVARLVAEVDALHALGAHDVFVVDDNFIGNKKAAKALLRELVGWQVAHGYPVEFMTEVSLNLAQDDELLRLMHDANFTSVFIGIESPRVASLEETGKTQNIRADLLGSVRKIQDAGIEVMAGMIVGFDNDDVSIFEEQFRFIQDARIPVSMTGLLNALPQTPLRERLLTAGRLDDEYTGDQFVFSNVIPAAMSRLELYEGYRDLLERLYDHSNYRRRAMAFLRDQGPEKRVRVSAGAHEVRIFLRVLWTCVLLAPPRRAAMTLRMLGETLLRRPSSMRKAVVLALMHKHLHEYAVFVRAELDRIIVGLRAPAPPPVAVAELVGHRLLPQDRLAGRRSPDPASGHVVDVPAG
ncbi:MAG: B12-binding domain-containing radical SAM protein [Deltaproteobacteria bacterium]|nr:B12-binding domain-containing radical SAM protein [Deltaproteobacteria bacterium]